VKELDMQAQRSVGFIGFGATGMGMARNLMAAGYEVMADDIAAEPLQRSGILSAD
jgi:3-hydroxyisobutyrate dehydrogenase-like beta-hydroxyacid dehydrogenase